MSFRGGEFPTGTIGNLQPKLTKPPFLLSQLNLSGRLTVSNVLKNFCKNFHLLLTFGPC